MRSPGNGDPRAAAYHRRCSASLPRSSFSLSFSGRLVRLRLPLASAVAALVSGLGVIGLLSHAMNVSTVTPELAQLMVIGVGIDYALFIVTRHRRNLLNGMSVPDSITLAVNTSGRAVLFAGTTVCIAMLGLIALGVSFFYGMAVGVAVAVSLTMIASLTLLPALLSFLGLSVLPRKQRRAIRAGTYASFAAHRILDPMV